jgi:hypothetical protein
MIHKFWGSLSGLVQEVDLQDKVELKAPLVLHASIYTVQRKREQ